MGNRWRTHRVLAWAVRALIFLLPIVAGIVVSYLVAARIPDGETVPEVLAWWTAVVGGAVLAAMLVDRMLRRLVPVTTLLRLSLVFPDKAPSRFSVMMRTFTTRSIGRRLAAGELDHLPAERSASEELLDLLASLAAHDPQTRGHAERVRAYADLIGEELGLGESERERLRWGALLHDIGKVAVPASLLNKPDALDESEWDVMRTHPMRGDELINGLHDWLGDWRLTVVEHHERWDGSGYPLGLTGRGISLGGRIVSVCDAFDAMTSVRAYGERVSAEDARTEIATMSGDQFDPRVVRALMRVSIGRLRAPIGVWAWLPAFTVPGAIERLGKHASVVAASLLVFVGATALAADQITTPQPGEIEVAGITVEPSGAPVDPATESTPSLEASSTGPEEGRSEPSEGITDDFSSAADASTVDADTLSVSATSDPGASPDLAASEPGTPNAIDVAAAATSSTTTTTAPPAATTTTTPPPTTTTTVVVTSEPPPPLRPVAPSLTVAVDEDGLATFELVATGVTELVEPPTRGVAQLDGEGRGSYRPNPDVHGADSFTYRACVGAECVTGLVSLEIAPINDAPIAVDDVAEVSTDGSVTILVLENDGDIDGDPLTVTAVGVPAHGVATTDGTAIEFRPLGESADVSFEYVVCDPDLACSTGLVQVDVIDPLTAVAVDDTFSIAGTQPTKLDVLANDDVGIEDVTITILEEPIGGTARVLGNDGIRYKPLKGTTADRFTYEVCDAAGVCSQATVTITVE